MSKVVAIASGNLSAQIKLHGAELSSLQRGDDEFLWQADERWWGRHAPVLFPIVGSIRNDKAQTAAGTCHMGRHGIARLKDFTVAEQSADTVTLELCSDADTTAAFPYSFVLHMSYSLEASAVGGAVDTLRQSFSVTNTGTDPLPFSVGGHPAFNVPAPQHTGAWEDYALRFTQPWSYVSPGVNADGLWDYQIKTPIVDKADKLPLDRQLFCYDTIELEGTPDSRVTLVDGADKPVLHLDFEGFPYLGIWSPGCESGDAPFVAIEPWTGTATRTDEDDILEHKQGSLTAQSGETVERAFTITLL